MTIRHTTLVGQYAGFVTRAVAWTIDLLIISLTVFAIFWVTRTTLLLFRIDISNCPTSSSGVMGLIADFCALSRLVVTITSLLFAPVYFIFFWTLGGQTIGKYVMGVRVVQLDGEPVRLSTSVVRVIGYGVSLLALGLGFVWSIIDDQRQGWHDKFAKTCVIYAWQALPDEGFSDWLNKRLRLPPSPPLSLAAPEQSLQSSESTLDDTSV